jgi:hypothetical protein
VGTWRGLGGVAAVAVGVCWSSQETRLEANVGLEGHSRASLAPTLRLELIHERRPSLIYTANRQYLGFVVTYQQHHGTGSNRVLFIVYYKSSILPASPVFLEYCTKLP